jgi:hypothetical protein
MVFLAVTGIAVCVILTIAIFRRGPDLFIFRLIDRVFGKRYSHSGRAETTRQGGKRHVIEHAANLFAALLQLTK